MSDAISLFQLATEVAREHETFSGSGTIRVVPVIVENLDAARPVIDALCKLMNGRFFDASAPVSASSAGDERDEALSLHAPVPGTSDPVRRGAVEAALVADSERNVILRDVGNDLVDAVLDNPPTGAEPSPGERVVTAIARAALHRDLDQFEFVAIAYSNSSIDLPFQRAVWRLWVEQLANMPNASLKTLLVVLEGEIEINTHCKTGLGFRFAVQEQRLRSRNDRDSLRASAASIGQHRDPLVLFLGAGFSVSSGLPPGNALRDGAIRRLLDLPAEESPTSQDLCGRFFRWLSARHRLSPREEGMQESDFVRALTLERVVRAERDERGASPTLEDFRARHDAILAAPGGAVRDLARMLQHATRRMVIVEVNFDRLVETHSGVSMHVFATEDQFSEAAGYVERYLRGEENDVPLLKLHGTIEDSESCVVNEEQTERGIGEGKLAALNALLGSTESPRMWIYVGASMRDRDLLPVLRREDFARGLDERWVSPYLMDTVEQFMQERAPLWNKLSRPDDRLITEMADPFFAALADAWIAAG